MEKGNNALMPEINQNILEEVKQIVIERLEFDIQPEDMDTETKLMAQGLGFDSITVLDILAAFEEHFDFVVEDEDLSCDIFENLGSLTKFATSVLAKNKKAS